MAEKRTKGFHALEKKIHDMEEADRAEDRKAGAKREAKPEEKAPVMPPPAAHDE